MFCLKHVSEDVELIPEIFFVDHIRCPKFERGGGLRGSANVRSLALLKKYAGYNHPPTFTKKAGPLPRRKKILPE